MSSEPNETPLLRLQRIMLSLRKECSWDSKQDFASIAPYAIEEAYELVDAIERGDMDDVRNELGDLLFQVIFHACMASEADLFDFDDIATTIADKMERRHPHIFGKHIFDKGAPDNRNNNHEWEDMKQAERAAKSQTGLLDDVPRPLPALTRAVKLQKRAARVGFDWADAAPIFAKLDEEIAELKAEMSATPDPQRIKDELGDVLFVVANLARHLGIEPETALRSTNDKFTRRFQYIESQCDPRAASLEEMESLWQKAKEQEPKT